MTQNSRALLETMDTDQCIQKLVRTELEGSECAQCKLEETIQYWAVQEKKAAMNYHHTLELNNSVPNKRVETHPKYPRIPRATERHKYARDNT